MWRAFLIGLFASVTRFAFSQGGPPMITDDPGTPGNGKWEINLPLAFEHRPGEWALDAPGLDLNYGWGDHIQLTLQTALGLFNGYLLLVVGGVTGFEGIALSIPPRHRRRGAREETEVGNR